MDSLLRGFGARGGEYGGGPRQGAARRDRPPSQCGAPERDELVAAEPARGDAARREPLRDLRAAEGERAPTWFAWIAFTNSPSVMEGELHVIELASGDERAIGTARSLRWLDDERVIAHVRGNEMAVIDVVTGAYSDPGSLNLNSDPFAEEASGVRLEDMTPEVTGAPPWRRQYRIMVPDGAQLDFEAYRARLAPDGMVAFAVAPEDAETDVAWGTPIPGNIYLADPHSLEAEYVGTGLLSYGSWPLDVSEQFVFWTDDSCGLAEGGSRFYDRALGAVTAVDVRLYGEFTPSGLLAVEEFGADHLLDPAAMEYDLVLRAGHNVFWSPDYRYAAAGAVPGQGGRCG